MQEEEVTIRIIKRFRDKRAGHRIRAVDQKIKVNKDRADELIQKGYAELIQKEKCYIEPELAVKEVETEKAVPKKPTTKKKTSTKKKPAKKKEETNAEK